MGRRHQRPRAAAVAQQRTILYISIDLETILDGNLCNEFALVFRLLHRSRLPTDGSDLHDCLLETWYQQGIDEGGRVRDRLRDGVKTAVETLASGFLGHPANNALRASSITTSSPISSSIVSC